VEKDGEDWVLYTRDRSRVLGRHKTAKGAYSQEYAIYQSIKKKIAPVGDDIPVDEAIEKAAFGADLSPSDMREEYNSIVGKVGPLIAGSRDWKSSYFPEGTNQTHFLNWYSDYHNGKRNKDEDEIQIKRWNSYRARSIPVFLNKPTARMAYSLRNWGIDPVKLLEGDEKKEALKKSMDDYKQKEEEKYEIKKACCDPGFPKLASTDRLELTDYYKHLCYEQDNSFSKYYGRNADRD
jgi:hypothetical protein